MNRTEKEQDASSSNHTTSLAAEKPERMSKRMARKFMTGKGIFTFLRSSVSSQIASWTDMGVCFLFYAWVLLPMGENPWRSFVATAIGLVVGGVVNCCINYKFTFRAGNCSVKAVAVKYILIWAGSFLLNVWGTTGVNALLQQITLLGEWGIKPDGIFAFARLSVSLVVSLAWNYVLQKNFVYRPTRFDPWAIRLVDTLTFHRRKR